MPPTRRARASNGPAAKGAQQTLSFGSKVTKSTTQSSKIHKAATNEKPIPAKEVDGGHTSSEAAIVEEVQAELVPVERERTEEEERASKVTDAQIKRYWKSKESERKAPRVHQADLSIEEKILRLFDTSSQYGPCIGIARMKRWVRANKLCLQPPIEVLAVLLREEKKGNTKIGRAHVDELMSSKFIINDD